MAGGQGFEVTPDELHKAAREVDDVAGRAQQTRRCSPSPRMAR